MTPPGPWDPAPPRLVDRDGAWQDALARDTLPDFVRARLADTAAGRRPWVATMTPAELLLAKSHGVRPVASVSGTCWFHYGWSWTEGHEAGWSRALARIGHEAAACGANAVVDVRMRTLRHSIGASMDFTLFGTAVRIDGLAPSPDPVIATVPALEFVRLVEMNIVPTGLAVGARYDWLGGGSRSWGGGAMTQWQTSALAGNQPLDELGHFWEGIRREAHLALRANAARQGNGVLAHTHFGEIIRQEGDKQPPAFLGRHIVIGTVIQTQKGADVPHGIEPVVDMSDDPVLRGTGGRPRRASYGNEGGEGGAI